MVKKVNTLKGRETKGKIKSANAAKKQGKGKGAKQGKSTVRTAADLGIAA